MHLMSYLITTPNSKELFVLSLNPTRRSDTRFWEADGCSRKLTNLKRAPWKHHLATSEAVASYPGPPRQDRQET